MNRREEMALLDDVDQRLSNWINAGTDKAKEMSGSMKISNEIKEEEKNQEELYKQIGIYFYENCSSDAEGQLKELCQKIDEGKERVLLKQKQLNVLRGMINCPNCGAEVSSDSVFCNACGSRMKVEKVPDKAKQEKRCSNCGAPIEDGFAFCTSCGHKIVEREKEEDTLEEMVNEESETEENMNVCPNCGKVITQGNTFCTGCGWKVEKSSNEIEEDPIVMEETAPEKRCPRCNVMVNEEQKFCISCGMKLEQAIDEISDDTILQNKCPNCGKEVEQGDLFCINCGMKIE